MSRRNIVKKLWSSSYGITSNQQLSLFFPSTPIHKIGYFSNPNATNIVIGWGNKPNTETAKVFASKHDIPFVRLEDGFIGYLGHPSSDKNRLSLIKDDVGIYYDARHPSRLEQLCTTLGRSTERFPTAKERRANDLVSRITSSGISKYNHERSSLPAWLNDLINESASECILLIDQTAGDQSITSGLANAESFQKMLQAALIDHPNKTLIIKTHPDVLISGKGGKQGHFHSKSSTSKLPKNVHLLTDDCSIPELMNNMSDVYVVTSQLGFEALLYGKTVHCFGMPFYSGWGLTLDQQVCSRRTVKLTLPQLVYASLIDYPTYLHPESQTLCEVEDVVDWLVLQLEGSLAVDICYAFGFSLWKRAFVKQFVGRLSKKVVFVNDESKLETLLQKLNQKTSLASNSKVSTSVLLWGRSRSAWAARLRKHTDVWFMEDGFLRSVGLGADLRRPSCLVIDRQGMYYDSSENSDVIDILNAIDLTPTQRIRAENLAVAIRQNSVTKYNVGSPIDSKVLLAQLNFRAGEREIIVVPGQFENDLSIACSLGEIKTNIALLAQVKTDYPAAFIIFKEHPDVYSGVRPGALGEQSAKQFADLYVADIDMDSLLACVDRVCTLTSLTGFEALLRNKTVTVYGSPFYAGWGLTTDKLTLPNRHEILDFHELIYGAMIEYSRYVDWNTGYLTGPEQTVSFLAQQRENSKSEALNSGWLARQARKSSYFFHSYFR